MPKAFGFTEFGGTEHQSFLDLPKPAPGPGEMLVAVRATAVSPADWKLREGWMRGFMPIEPPAPFGFEVDGTVEELGEGVAGFAVGDEVFGLTSQGGYSEYALVRSGSAAHKPSAVSFTDAATLVGSTGTAYDVIEQGGLGADATVVITGAGGGVGIPALQLARARGIDVIGTASAAKQELVESFGATHVTYGDGVADRIRAVAPDGVDAIFDLVGGEALREIVGVAKDGAPVITAADPFTAAELGGVMVTRHTDPEALANLAELVASGTVDPYVTQVFTLDRAADALALVEGGHATGKVVIEIL